METKEQPEEKAKIDMLSHFEWLKEEFAKSSPDLYPQVLEKNKMQPRMMSFIEKK